MTESICHRQIDRGAAGVCLETASAVLDWNQVAEAEGGAWGCSWITEVAGEVWKHG